MRRPTAAPTTTRLTIITTTATANHRRQAVGKPDRAACDGRLRLGWSGLTNQPETRITFDTWAATSCDPDDARRGDATLG